MTSACWYDTLIACPGSSPGCQAVRKKGETRTESVLVEHSEPGKGTSEQANSEHQEQQVKAYLLVPLGLILNTYYILTSKHLLCPLLLGLIHTLVTPGARAASAGTQPKKRYAGNKSLAVNSGRTRSLSYFYKRTGHVPPGAARFTHSLTRS